MWGGEMGANEHGVAIGTTQQSFIFVFDFLFKFLGVGIVLHINACITHTRRGPSITQPA